MSRTGVTVSVLLLVIGMLVVARMMDGSRDRSTPSEFATGPTDPVVSAVGTQQPMPESLAHLQFVADRVRCPVSSRSAIMTSCLVERYHKLREKALLWRAKYERLEGLERAYWAALAREGLTQRVEHVSTRAP